MSAASSTRRSISACCSWFVVAVLSSSPNAEMNALVTLKRDRCSIAAAPRMEFSCGSKFPPSPIIDQCGGNFLNRCMTGIAFVMTVRWSNSRCIRRSASSYTVVDESRNMMSPSSISESARLAADIFSFRRATMRSW